MSLLVVGSVAFDALESPYGKVDRTVGRSGDIFRGGREFFCARESRGHCRRRLYSERRSGLSRDGTSIQKAWNERKGRLSFGQGGTRRI